LVMARHDAFRQCLGKRVGRISLHQFAERRRNRQPAAVVAADRMAARAMFLRQGTAAFGDLVVRCGQRRPEEEYESDGTRKLHGTPPFGRLPARSRELTPCCLMVSTALAVAPSHSAQNSPGGQPSRLAGADALPAAGP